MRRAAALVIVFGIFAVVATGCQDDSTVNVSQAGVEVNFSDCLIFAVNVFINESYQGTASTERSKFFALNPGSYRLFARSNASLENAFFCWEYNITVKEGETTVVRLSCDDAECSE